jgi:glycosyltransferase involved in cell wall biosynthesis
MDASGVERASPMRSASERQPLVTAIIATYNRSYIVCEAIESILHQSYEPIELIVIDDGSTDDTLAKLVKYGERIRVVSQKNAGPAAAWNRGILESRGEIVTFLGSDDIWLPTFVERQMSVLQRLGDEVPCSVSSCWLRFADGRGVPSFQYASLYPRDQEGVWLNPGEILATRFVQFGQNVAIRRAALEKAGGFDEKLWLLEDYDLALKLSLQGPWGFVREPLVVWRQGTAANLSLSQKALVEQAHLKENLITIRSRILDMNRGSARSESLRKLLQRELRLDRRDLWFARSAQRGAWGRVALRAGQTFSRGENYLYRRSSSYPRMKTAGFATPAA